MKWMMGWFVLLGLVVYGPALAAKQDWYSVTVPLANSGDAAMDKATQQAFYKVIARVDCNTPSLKAISEQLDATPLSEVKALVKSYRVMTRLEGGQQKKYLLVRFHQVVSERLLKEKSFTVCDEVRPSTLVWFVTRDVSGANFLEDKQSRDEVTALMEEAGLEAVFPLLDLQELSAVDPGELVQGDIATQQTLAKRYNADASVVLLVQPKQGDRAFHGALQATVKNQVHRLTGEGKSQGDVILSLMSAYRDLLFKEFVAAKHNNKTKQTLDVLVSRIQSYRQYGSLTEYLENSPSVSAISVRDVAKDTVRLNVSVVGELNDFYQQLHADGRVAFTGEEGAYYDVAQMKQFTWVQ